MKMKRKVKKRLLLASLIIVILACGICAIGATRGSVYIQTKGTPSENIEHLFTSALAGDGKTCARCTDSYKTIDFTPSKSKGTIANICKALRQSYSFEPVPAGSDGTQSLTSEDTVQFSSLDLNKLADDITAQFEDYVFDAVKEYDKDVTVSEGKYIPEVYEKAYALAVKDLLKKPEKYYTTETIKLKSYYDIEKGRWYTDVSNKLANMFLGGLPGGISADGISIPKAVKAFVNDSVAILKGETVQRRNNYTLSYKATVAPKPDKSNYVTVPVKNADQVLNIINYARSCGLLGDQKVIFDPKADFYAEDIVCYCDETILVICWKEIIKGCVCNCMEVKLADGSQIKRKLTGDKYDSGKLDTVTNMSIATNAVAAMSADYYAYRDIGVTVYQGKLCRYQLSCEALMIDDKGRFVFYYPDEQSADELQAFIDKNKIQFGLAFGPVLIDNYEPRYYVDGYAFGLGEMKERYSRSAFGEFDDLHYLFMTSGYSEKTLPPKDLDAFIKILRTKKLKNAYNLDGGQTAEIVIQNNAYNRIDYGGERQVSDMVFFATAIPEKEDE